MPSWREAAAMSTQLPPFATELFFADYEFTSPYLLAASDCETFSIGDLLQLANTDPGELLELKLGYTESWGNPEMRQAVAARYEGVASDDVLILGSPIEGLYLTNQVLTGECIVLTPAYDALKNLPENMKTWSLLPTSDSWCLDFDSLDELVTEQTELLVVNFPHNPTGYVPTPAEWNRLQDWCKEKNVRLFCDEMYAGLLRPETAALSSAVEHGERSLILGGLSKSHGLPGLRAGWIVCRDRELLKRLHDRKLYTSICPPGPVEKLATIALTVEQKLVERSNQIIEANLKVADTFFQKFKDRFVWRRPLGASVALVELIDESSAEAFAGLLADQHGIVLLPGTFLGFPDRYLRFGFGRHNFPENLQALENLLLKW